MNKKRLLLIGTGLLIIIAAVVVFLILRSNSSSVPAADKPKYVVSLGDSLSAGDGLPVASGSPATCNRSDQAFGVMLAAKLDAPLEQFACSGATIPAGMTGAQFTGLAPQLDAAKPYLAGSDVTLTIGINDIGGFDLLEQCAKADCGSADQLASLQAKLTALSTDYGNLLSTIKSAQPKHIVVNTYYYLFATGDSCFASFGLTSDKVAQVNTLEMQLNQTISDTAKAASVKVVPIDFKGHTLCAGTPWIQGLLDKAPLHPTAEGQKQIAAQDFEALTQ